MLSDTFACDTFVMYCKHIISFKSIVFPIAFSVASDDELTKWSLYIRLNSPVTSVDDL